MSENKWFSAMVRLALIAGNAGTETYMRSVFVFRAAEWGDARVRALELGRSREDEYLNSEGKRVLVRLLEIETLDLLSMEELDGAEVYSEPRPAGPEGREITADSDVHPEESHPIQTGVS